MTPLDYSFRRGRTLANAAATIAFAVLACLAALPLFSLLWMLIERGSPRFDLQLFMELPPAPGTLGGGLGNALVGTLVVVALGTIFSVPVGLLLGIHFAEIDPNSKTSAAARFCTKVLSGLPSLIAGVFAYSTVVVLTGRFSPVAGGVALAILMIPIIALTTEEALRAVPRDLSEAAYGLGARRSQVILEIRMPAARSGIITGILMALSRAAGETAPLIFAMSFSDYWMSRDFLEPTASLAVLIFQYARSPFAHQREIAWSAALLLALIVLLLTLASRLVALISARPGRKR